MPDDHVVQDADATADYRVGRTRASTVGSEVPPAAPTLDWDGAGEARGRYRLVAPHAAGGLGRLWLARDTELDRSVALKEIRPELADHAPARRRFAREAHATGRLEHPGIVPIHGRGDCDGRPYYAMRLVQGDSLKEAIVTLHRLAGPERHLALRDLLTRFAAVCQAIDYAHSRGIVHRDLKPENVMLGPFGETLVVDWGLAKEHRRPGDDRHADDAGDAGDAGTAGDADWAAATGATPADAAGPTVAGQALGTPEYMSPEQARGDSDTVGPAADVYALGATLAALLTGRPPVGGATIEETLSRVQTGRTRVVRPAPTGTPAPLWSVCRKAMALGPSGRYAGAGEVAVEIRRWLADEPVAAHPEAWPTRALRWLRRHQTAAVAAAVALTVAALVAAGGWTAVSRANRDLAHARAETADRVARLAERNAALEKARAAETQARGRSDRITAFLVSTFRKPEPDMDGEDVTVARILRQAEDGIDALADDPAARIRLLRAVADGFGQLGLEADRARVLERQERLWRRHRPDDERGLLETRTARFHALKNDGRLDAARRLGGETFDRLDALYGLADPLTREAGLYLALCWYDIGHDEAALALGLRLRASFDDSARPGDADTRRQAEVLDNLTAMLLMRSGRCAEAETVLRRLLRAPDDPADAARTRNRVRTRANLAVAQFQQDRTAEALATAQAAYDQARRLADEDHPIALAVLKILVEAMVAADHPEATARMVDYAAAVRRRFGPGHFQTLTTDQTLLARYRSLGRWDKAVGVAERAAREMADRSEPLDPHVFIARAILGETYADAGRPQDALRELSESVRRFEPVLDAGDPGLLSARLVLARTLDRLDLAGAEDQLDTVLAGFDAGPAERRDRHPVALWALRLRAELRLHDGRTDAAAEDLRRVWHALDPARLRADPTLETRLAEQWTEHARIHALPDMRARLDALRQDVARRLSDLPAADRR